MKSSKLQVSLKILVSIFFLFLLLRKTDFRSSMEALKNCHLPLAAAAVTLTVMLASGLALRLFILVRKQAIPGNITYPSLLKLTMVGIFFNNFLPTGAGGDIAKVFFLVKGEEKKLLVGSSVLVDRFLGAFSIMAMGTLSSWITPGIPLRHKMIISVIMLFLLFVLFFFANKKPAFIFYSGAKKLMPEKATMKLRMIYNVFASYFSAGKALAYALGTSFIVQSLSIFANYLIGLSLAGGQAEGVPLSIFFTYVPLIWASTLIPSLGGLGIREFTYMYFFSAHMGEEKAVALSILILSAIIIQSIIGGIILLFLKIPGRKASSNCAGNQR